MQGTASSGGGKSLTWYADNSELKGIKGAEIPDILLFGGILVDQNAESSLRVEIQDIKEKYSGDRHVPVKWNFKDLKRFYEDNQLQDTYQVLVKSSREWRLEIFEKLSEFDIKLVVACIEGYSVRRDTLKSVKDDLTRYIFSNALMRLGLYAQETKPRNVLVVLDWPDKGNTKPFDVEYESALIYGKTSDGNVIYKSGKLEALGFSDSVTFANDKYTTMLQIADIIVGATRELIEYCLGKKDVGQGIECLRKVWSKFRGSPHNIVGRGLIIPSGNNELMNRIKNCIGILLDSPPTF